MTISRRYFLGAISAFAISPLLASERAAVDTVLFNGRIWTVDDKLPTAEAIAISNGRIFAAGTNDECWRSRQQRHANLTSGGRRCCRDSMMHMLIQPTPEWNN